MLEAEPERDHALEISCSLDLTEVGAERRDGGRQEVHATRRVAALRKFADVTVPEPDPLAGLERLPVRDPLTGVPV